MLYNHTTEETKLIQPIFDRVLVKRVDASKTTASGIILSDPGKQDMGDVIATGPGHIRRDGSLRPMSVKVGDRIVFGEHTGQIVKHDGVEYLMMNEADVVGIVE